MIKLDDEIQLLVTYMSYYVNPYRNLKYIIYTVLYKKNIGHDDQHYYGVYLCVTLLNCIKKYRS